MVRGAVGWRGFSDEQSESPTLSSTTSESTLQRIDRRRARKEQRREKKAVAEAAMKAKQARRLARKAEEEARKAEEEARKADQEAAQAKRLARNNEEKTRGVQLAVRRKAPRQSDASASGVDAKTQAPQQSASASGVGATRAPRQSASASGRQPMFLRLRGSTPVPTRKRSSTPKPARKRSSTPKPLKFALRRTGETARAVRSGLPRDRVEDKDDNEAADEEEQRPAKRFISGHAPKVDRSLYVMNLKGAGPLSSYVYPCAGAEVARVNCPCFVRKANTYCCGSCAGRCLHGVEGTSFHKKHGGSCEEATSEVF